MEHRLAVKSANEEFYDALEHYNLDLMRQLWLHAPWITCVHPGWEIRRGWQQVEESWEAIFGSGTSLKIQIEDVEEHIHDNCAWVVCTEIISASMDRAFVRSRAISTNVFLKEKGQWYMVHHHASPAPEDQVSVSTTTVQ